MIELSKGNLLEAQVEALVNTVNTQGIMGKGVALQFKNAFPEMFKVYQKACKDGEIQIGRVHTYETKKLIGPRFIINFPTKKNWRESSKIEYIQSGLKSLVEEVRKRQIRSIALPPLGCGMGGLAWAVVFPLIKEVFAQIPEVQVFAYPPQQAFEAERKIVTAEKPEMNLSRANIISIWKQYCVLGYELTLLEIHKLLYFLQEAGEPLRLRFSKQDYGPYAENLRFVLDKFEGHFICGFRNSRNKPDTPIALIPEAVSKAEVLIRESSSENMESAQRVQRVTELIEGFESPYGMELLTTVHWLFKKEQIKSEDKIVESVHGWSERKQNMMKPEHIKLAWKRLKEKNWIN